MKKKMAPPVRDGRVRLWKKFNLHNQGFTHLTRINGVEQYLAHLSLMEGVEHVGWYQNEHELVALYTLNNTIILLDRFDVRNHAVHDTTDGSFDSVLCVGGSSWQEVCDTVLALNLEVTELFHWGDAHA